MMKNEWCPVSAILFLLVLLYAPGLKAEAMPRCEHPRPDLERASWQCLNGEWDFRFDPATPETCCGDEALITGDFDRKIMVPFEIESALSGIKLGKKSEYYLGYRRRFALDPALKGTGKIVLHFEAVDYRAKVWLNGKYLGEHTGGYTPFSFDITEAVKDGENELAVNVFDSSNRKQVRGKQSSTGKGYSIWYTPCSGIWQPVWVERVGESYIAKYETNLNLAKREVGFIFQINNFKAGQKISVMAVGPDGKELKTNLEKVSPGPDRLIWKIEDPKLWSPDEPNLYQLKFVLLDEQGKALDEVKSYLGLREVRVKDGKVLLNGKPIYQKLALVQGYFPPGIYSPQSDEAFRKDLELLKEMGFNGLRMHQKVEPKRYYYWAARLGLLIWQDMPAMASEISNTFLPVEKIYRDRFDREWSAAMARDENEPSIIAWVPFNESWGIWPEGYHPVIRSWALKVVETTRLADPTRLVVDNSGWLHRDTDLLDVHHYVSTAAKSEVIYQRLKKPWGTYSLFGNSIGMVIRGAPMLSPLFYGVKYSGQPIIVSEYGGFGFYKTAEKTLLDNYRDYTLAIGKYPYLQGFCYTQEYDVEQEKNGLLDENRNPKVPLAEIKKINDQIGR